MTCARCRWICVLSLMLCLAGCSTLNGGKPPLIPRPRTLAGIGDRPGAVLADSGVDATEPAADPDGRISGRVVDAQGNPVAGAEVRLAADDRVAGRVTRARADVAGGFTLKGLRAGRTYRLVAESDEGTQALEGRQTAEAPSRRVRITLRPAGRAVAEAERDQETDAPTYAKADPDEAGSVAAADEPEVEEPRPPAARSRQVAWRAAGSTRSVDPEPEPIEEARPAAPDPPKAKVKVKARAKVEPPEDFNPLPPAIERPASKAPRPEPEPASAAEPPAVEVLPRPEPMPEIAPRPEPPPVKPAPAPAPAARPAPLAEPEVDPLPPAAEAVPTPRPTPTPVATAEPKVSVPSSEFAPVEPAPAAEAMPAPVEPAPVAEPKPAGVEPAPAAVARPPVVEPAPAEDIPAPAAPAEVIPRPAVAAEAPKLTWDEVDTRTRAQLGRFPLKGAAPVAEALADAEALKPGSTRGRAPAGVEVVRASCRVDAAKARVVDFTLPGVDGRPVRLKDIDADLVLLDFWGSWCGPCVKSVPHLVELQKRFGDRKIRVVGVAYEEVDPERRAAVVASAARRLGINYTLLVGEADGRPCPLKEGLNVHELPTLVLLDRSGKILLRETGGDARTLARLDRVVASNLDPGVVRR